MASDERAQKLAGSLSTKQVPVSQRGEKGDAVKKHGVGVAPERKEREDGNQNRAM